MSFITSMPPAVAAPAAAVVTPTINEFEQASFYADDGQQVLLHQDQDRCGDKQQPLIPTLEGLIDITLPSSCFYSPAIATDETLESYIGHDRDAFESIASLASLAAAAASPSPASNDAHQECSQEPSSQESDANDVMEAAGILCHFKKSSATDCSPEDASEIVDMTVEMLSDQQDDHAMEEEQHCWDLPQENDNAMTSATNIVDSLVHPDRLATEDDAEEVNKLHQYVRKDLLEIFVVPRATTTSDSDDDDDHDEEEENGVNSSSNAPSNATNNQRLMVTRHRSIPISSATTAAVSTTTAHRHYPGRVGIRCVHCANVRRKPVSKAAFYPLRLKNVYREVCAWQRIHFKKCPHVPAGVRERYDHYKRIDTTRGKVRYWETSARRIGLQNNPDRDDGVVFAQTAWKA